MSNRVEELERQVGELQAAVNGLTEELVEMKERVRELEEGDRSVPGDAAAEAASGTDQPSAGPTPEEPVSERTTKSDDHVDVVEQAAEETDAGSPQTNGASAEGADGAGEESRETADDGDTEESDIIVA
jgi:TolA-binding protein